MPDIGRISLNAVRVFLTAARHRSIKLAAAELGVTAGAVSHQVKGLEAAMGVQLVIRKNNAIDLTDVGDRLVSHAAPELHKLEQAVKSALPGHSEIMVQAPVTFATRWLIPRLQDFRRVQPDMRISVETTTSIGLNFSDRCDVCIAYHSITAMPKHADVLLLDACRPYLSPNMLKGLGADCSVESVPAIQSSSGNWDWHLWLQQSYSEEMELNFVGQFDLDDAALRAASAGIGMVLAPEFMVRDDVKLGALVALPSSKEVQLGIYSIHRNGPPRREVELFCKWLTEAVKV